MPTPLSTSSRTRGLPALALVSLVVAPLLTLGACARTVPPQTGAVEDMRAPLGVRVQTLAEGLLVVGVQAGSGAEQAGLVTGDLIVEVDGVQAVQAPNAARHGLRGPTGTTVEVVVRAPDGGDYRQVQVVRGSSPPARIGGTELPAQVRALRLALLDRGPRAVGRATDAAMAADFGGMVPSLALSHTLGRALARKPKAAVAAAERLHGAYPDDDALWSKLGEVWLDTGDLDRAVEALRRSEELRPPDVWDPATDWRGDAGGNPRGRARLVRALWRSGQHGPAIDAARALLASTERPELAARVGMAPPRSPQPWRAALPPVGELQAETLDGETWSLEEQRGKLVILSFFATWCGPCRAELPMLQALWTARQGQGLEVIGISVDDPRDVGLVPAFVDELGLDFPVAHAPAAGERFGVGAIPALRVIDRDGALLYSARGYSPRAAVELVDVVTEALAEGPEGGRGGAPLGWAWAAADAELGGFLGLPGAHDLVLTDADLAIGRDQGPPVVLAGDGTGASSTVEGPGGGGRLAWLDGPVSSQAGAHWVRAHSTTGRVRWTLTTSTPVQDLAASGETLWIATEARLLAVDRLGRVEHALDLGARGLAPHPDGGVWAVDGDERLHIEPQGRVAARSPAEGAWRVDATGRVASGVFGDLLTGRFGPEGALRSVVVRGDGTVVGLDGQGAPAFTWSLEDPPRIDAGDIDGDGQDELLVAVRRQGLATVRLRLP